MPEYDILVVGGSMASLYTALATAEAGAQGPVVDKLILGAVLVLRRKAVSTPL